MNGVLFKDLLASAGLTVAQFCRETDTPRATADNWMHEKRRAPKITIAYLNLYIEHKKDRELLERLRSVSEDLCKIYNKNSSFE